MAVGVISGWVKQDVDEQPFCKDILLEFSELVWHLLQFVGCLARSVMCPINEHEIRWIGTLCQETLGLILNSFQTGTISSSVLYFIVLSWNDTYGSSEWAQLILKLFAAGSNGRVLSAREIISCDVISDQCGPESLLSYTSVNLELLQWSYSWFYIRVAEGKV